MDKTNIAKLPIFHETKFRTPGRHEKRCGLWVDRIGSGGDRRRPARTLRILGQYAVVALESGDGEVVTNERVVKVHAGDAILLQPRLPCTYFPVETWYSRWVVWNGPYAPAAAATAGWNGAEPVWRGVAQAVRTAFFALVALMDREDVASALERQAVVLKMLADMVRIRVSVRLTESARSDVTPSIRHIRAHLDTRLPVADLAALCHVSVPHFRRLFRSHTGESPVSFINAQRISRARELLARGVPIKQAARETGFDDVLYFMRVFKRFVGQTAGQFRESSARNV